MQLLLPYVRGSEIRVGGYVLTNQTANGQTPNGRHLMEKIVPCSFVAATDQERGKTLPGCLRRYPYSWGGYVQELRDRSVYSDVLWWGGALNIDNVYTCRCRAV